MLKVELFRTQGLNYIFGEWIGPDTKRGSTGSLWYPFISSKMVPKIFNNNKNPPSTKESWGFKEFSLTVTVKCGTKNIHSYKLW